jgi:hypothetical protein
VHWPTLRTSLLEGTYHPLPLRRKAIPKVSGGERWLATQSGMTNEWLKRQGLLSIRDLWTTIPQEGGIARAKHALGRGPGMGRVNAHGYA